MWRRRACSNDNRFLWVLAGVALTGLLLCNRLNVLHIASRNLGMIYFGKAVFNSTVGLGQRKDLIRMAKDSLQDALVNKVGIAESTAGLDLADGDATAQDFIAVGDLWMNQSNWSNAEDWYGLVIELDPSLSIGWYKLALSYEGQKRAGQAVEAYQQSIALANFPTDDLGVSDAHCLLGRLLREDEAVRDLGRSEELLRMGLRLAEFGSAASESDCLVELGNVLRWRNRSPVEYIEPYRQAVALNPQHSRALIMLGVAQYEVTGDAAQAEKSIQSALAIVPSVQAYVELAKVYEREQSYDQAIGMYEMALNLEPENKPIQDALALLQNCRTE